MRASDADRERAHSFLSAAMSAGVLATDALIMGGGRLTALSGETMSALDKVLPATWSHNNPVDIIGDAPPERYGMCCILTPVIDFTSSPAR